MYKTVIRTIHAGATVYDPQGGGLVIQNATETDMYLADTYPASKFNLVAVNFLGEIKVGNNTGLRYSWHFVETKGK